MAKNTEKITIKIEGEKWEKALDKSFQKNVKKRKVDGFRNGKVPKEMYIQKFGIESLYQDAVEMILDEAYKEAYNKRTIDPQIEPALEITQVDEKSVTLSFTFLGKPEVTLGEYKNLKIKKEKVNVTEEEIDHEIKHLRENFAEIREKEEGVVENGDTAVIDFQGEVDGKVFDRACGENYPLEIGSKTFIPGFEEGLLGMKNKESKDLKLQFPKEYDPEVAGKDVLFHVTVNEIKTRILPEINEDFFEDLGYDKVTNEKELRAEVKKVIEEDKQKALDDEFLDKVLEKASENMTIDLPEEIVDDEIHRMMHQFEEQMKMQGLKLEQYYQVTGTTKEDLHKNMEPEAKKRLKARYLLEAVAVAENIEVSDEEAEKDAEEMTKNYGISKEELLKAYGSMEVLKYDSKMRKTLKFLQENN